MDRYIEIKGKAKTYVAVAILLFLAWTMFGQSLINANLGFFNRGFQVSFFRGGHFEKHGVYWQQHNRSLGRIVSVGGESLILDLNAEIARGTLVILAWRWPAFLFDEPILHRARFDGDAKERIEVFLPEPGLYTLSVSGIRLRGDVTVDWRIED